MTDRYDIAWRIWCWQQGYNNIADRAILRNWMRDNESSMHPNDIRDRDTLLPIADEVIEMAKEMIKPAYDANSVQAGELVLADREILPISERKFGVIVTEEEGVSLSRSGYKVITLPVPSKRKKGSILQHHIEVYISAHDLKDDKTDARFDIPLLETVGRATVVVSPFLWRVGRRKGIKAYAKSIEIGNKEGSLADRAHAPSEEGAPPAPERMHP